ncbi:MAG: LPP20 family lipoprotein [Treponema sp.]|nr:LPP20 family lipoprotein [Treponema sp.]
MPLLTLLACQAAFSGCAGLRANPAQDAEAEAAAAASAAAGKLDTAGADGDARQALEAAQRDALPASGAAPPVSPAPSAPSSPAPSAPSSPAAAAPDAPRGSAPRAEPAWVASPESVFSRTAYVAAVGYGAERAIAEKNAFANLAGLFGQNISGEQTASSRYSEAVLNGAVDRWQENTAVTNAIKTSAQLQSLVGAEIKDYWYDGRTSHYAVAVMEREKTAILYADMIRSNEKIIDGLVSMDAAGKNTLDGYSRYRFAGTIADANRIFANVLSTVGSANTGINPGDMKKGDDYRLEAANIAKNIPVAVKVDNDRSNRIQGALAAAVNRAGLRGGGAGARYLVSAEISFSPVELPNQANRFVRYTLDVKLTDTGSGDVLLPYTVSGREGHISTEEAENRAVSAAERQINEKYGALLVEYLSALLPDRK